MDELGTKEDIDGPPGAATTYIVAQNPEILNQLMREGEGRGLNAAAYTTPASAFNTLAVDFASSSSTLSPKRKLKTKKLGFDAEGIPFLPESNMSSRTTSSSTLNNLTGLGSGVGHCVGNFNTLSSMGTLSTSSGSDVFNLMGSPKRGSKSSSNYGTLDKVNYSTYNARMIFRREFTLILINLTNLIYLPGQVQIEFVFHTAYY